MTDSLAPAMIPVEAIAEPLPPPLRRSLLKRILADWSVRAGGGVLLLLVFVSLVAPWLGTIDPTAIDPGSGNLMPGTRGEFNSLAGDTFEHLFVMGTDSLGRDIWSRTLYGARVSLTVGVAVAALAVVFGMLVGLLGGYFRRLDSAIMRLMDGVMAIPGILFAISLVALLILLLLQSGNFNHQLSKLPLKRVNDFRL